MATLHVRNVPDELYEALRRRAEDVGASISGMAVMILAEALSERGGTLFGRRRRRRPQPFERFTPIARSAVVIAQDEARALGHAYVGTEHLLLGLLAEGVSGRALQRLGLSPEGVRKRIVEIVGRGEGTPPGSIPFTPRAKKVLELGLREALAERMEFVGSEHVLLGITVEGEGVAAQILREAEADPNAIRAAVTLARAQGGLVEFRAEAASFRVIELTGSADEWEAALNDAAAEGAELVSIVSDSSPPRAVFRS
jgi:Clp amino terminal domain, pathogenicity island component